MTRRSFVVSFLIITLIGFWFLLSKYYFIPFFTSPIYVFLDRKLNVNNIEYDGVSLRWRPMDNAVHIEIENVRTKRGSAGLEIYAPKILIGAEMKPFIFGQVIPKYIHIIRPNVYLVDTLDNQGKAQLTNSKRNDSFPSTAIEGLLKMITSDPLINGEKSSSPTVTLTNMKLEILNELFGTRVVLSTVDMTVQYVIKGTKKYYDIQFSYDGQKLGFFMNHFSQYSDEGVTLLVNFENVRMSLIAEKILTLRYFKFLEIPISGTVDIKLNSYLDILSTEFKLTGGVGSFELVDYSGTNLNIDSMMLSGKSLDGLTRIIFDKVDIDLGYADAGLHGEIAKCEDGFAVSLNMILTNAPYSKVMPRWFSSLENVLADEKKSVNTNHTLLNYYGHYGFETRKIKGIGLLGKVYQRQQINKNAIFGDLPSDTLSSSLWFSVEGQIDDFLDFSIDHQKDIVATTSSQSKFPELIKAIECN